MKNIILIAPPAAGKGTQSKLINEKYHMPHISTGDLLRDAVVSGSEIGKLVKDDMKKGNLISDDIILKLLRNRIMESDCSNGYILDGFPRNTSQALAYNEILGELKKELGVVIVLDIDSKILKSRIVGRESCIKCGAIYNDMITESMPKVVGKCDKCNSDLIKRDDDNEVSFENRYETYLTKTKPLIDFYQQLGVLYYIDSIDKGETFNQIEAIIGANND